MAESVIEQRYIRNVAIIAHVDHGKTTLVDQLLYQSGMFRREELDKLAGGQHGLIFDSNPLERERGITIFSKNCALVYTAPDHVEYKVNVIDTPGHADFGGEVERVLSMADGVLLLVDACDGPMPQTRFVLRKALENKLKPIVVINKVDRPDARPSEVLNEVFDLLVELDADDDSLDFPTLYASGRDGWASIDPAERPGSLRAVFDVIIEHVPPPPVRPTDPLQLLVTTLDYSEYVGKIAIGRVTAGSIKEAQNVVVIGADGSQQRQRVLHLFDFEGLGKRRVAQVDSGDICAVTGLDPIFIGDTIADPDAPRALKRVAIDEPTLHMTFRINDGPFAGRDGTYVTSRQVYERLKRELHQNVALQVEAGLTADEFKVSGRGLMHLGILLENMRREGYELCAGKPQVIFKEVEGRTFEPIEELVIECPLECQGAVMGLIGGRRAELVTVESRAGLGDYVRLEFHIPARGLIGFREKLLGATQGRAIVHHTFLDYQPLRGAVPRRQNGVLVATEAGPVTAYALDDLYDRGTFFVKPGDEIYEGQVVGENCKDGDLAVNVVRTKKLTNIRAAGKDDAERVRAMRQLSLEAALEYIQEDELVEITPKSLRLRKRILKESDRRRAARSAKV